MPNRAQQHIHRKRRTQEQILKEKYLWLDKLCTVSSVLMPLSAVPQIYKLFYFQDAGSLSIWMWILYCFGGIPFFLYGIVHKIRPFIILNVMWMIVQFTMIIGILMYS